MTVLLCLLPYYMDIHESDANHLRSLPKVNIYEIITIFKSFALNKWNNVCMQKQQTTNQKPINKGREITDYTPLY